MRHKFVQTKIATKYGKFNLRVYHDVNGKEPLVLFTDKIDQNSSVLVRIHSECITSDMIGSLQCDCGNQLIKSMKKINDETGVLIYLRQEGRGIGLFEKIKAYQLQAKGHDTFEANVLLGHKPDERTYEMVKIALDDLKIQRIKLLTNNPSKVSEIAKLGIEISERIPLIVRSNKYNKYYFETKRDKFQHFFNKQDSYYFYQFHAEISDHIKQLAEFIQNKKKDPLLKIFVGIYADTSTLINKNAIKNIEAMCKECQKYENFATVLHFSFRKSKKILNDLEKIKKIFPYIDRLQVNDLPSIELSYLQHANQFFSSVDVPISDAEFNLIRKKRFRSFIKRTKTFILLDNSKGRGILEPIDSLKKKIDLLLSYGLNNIAIYGGFGPDKLSTYFELRRYYKINFSIDAETNLKTNGKIDIEKTKHYLRQLCRFDDPKKQGIEQTRAFLNKRTYSDWDIAKIKGKDFLIHPDVFHAGYFHSTAWFAEIIPKMLKKQTDFCEVGCGTGVISCFSAIKNPKLNIIATDINPFACENTKVNAKRLNIKDKINIVNGDVLDGVSDKQTFDIIFWSLPFGFLDPGIKINLQEIQVFDPGYRAIRKFFQTARKYLKPNGKLLIGFSIDLGHKELLEEFAKEFNLKLSKIKSKSIKEKKKIKFELLMGKYEN